ncbi:Ig-like domain-containing protein [Clostridium sp. CF012]|uniref:Ig-like domain-containing protein n=1 Tax=Clostridium sp. CF012 TaxID=2843319 RepID=UPI001C0D50C7|nr:Ig-like domain-containing protein [Clostridium sp. CF012]MBU3146957.1 Ig-like domain-containing protein [Clostridium sp. CF012]
MKKFYQRFISKVGIVFLMALVFGVLSCGSVYAVDTYSGNLIPTMTSNTKPSGIANASSENGSYSAWECFNKSFFLKSNYWMASTNSVPQWVSYKFPTSKTICKYTIKYINWYDVTRAPTSWIFQGSNDGTNWIDLDIRTGISWKSDETKSLIFNNTTAYTDYRVYISKINGSTSYGAVIDEIEMMEKIQTTTGVTLNKTTDSITVGQTDTLIASTTPSGIGVTWTSSDSTIATVDANGKVTAIKAGTTTVTATTTDGSKLSANCTVNVVDTITKKVVLNIEPEKNKIKKNETVTANLTIDNITNIAAEDIRIKYDSEKLEFIDFKEVDGIKLVKDDKKAGELRFILASKGKDNIVDAKKILLKLNFKGIKAGEALVDVVKGRVSDGIEIEKDLTDAECGQAIITIEEMKDVNNSGEYTLLDLAIDGRHLGEAPTTLPQYNTDVVANNAIDDVDLLEIGNQMLLNLNYKF